MHDGRFASLAEVLDFYAQGRAAASRGRAVGTREKTADLVPPLDANQKQDLLAFLQTLTSSPLEPELTSPR
jgi:cytochrome c peroxidase